MLYRDLIGLCRESGGKLSMIGRTETGLPIPCLQKGDPARSTLIFGGIHAREHITVELLLALWKAFEGDMTLVPCLNVDGLILATEGIGALGLSAREARRLIAVNGGSEDFSLWKANARAVDLNVNFDAGWGTGRQNVFAPAPANYVGPRPASEAETRAAVALMGQGSYAAVLAYHSKGEEIYYGFGASDAGYGTGKLLAAELGYALKKPQDSAGGLKDYWIKTTGRAGLTIEVGKDELPHPYPRTQLPALIDQHKRVLPLLNALNGRLWTKSIL